MTAAVYLGSRPGNDPKYCENARELGRLLAEAGIDVVYGGAGVGTMGAFAEGVISAGGKLTGVFPKGFSGRRDYSEKGIDVRLHNPGLELVETPDFATRIREMERRSDICIILPGSYGTMHEFFSYYEGILLGRFDRKIAILNTDGYYDPLLGAIRKMISEGFTDASDEDCLIVASTPEELVSRLKR